MFLNVCQQSTVILHQSGRAVLPFKECADAPQSAAHPQMRDDRSDTPASRCLAMEWWGFGSYIFLSFAFVTLFAKL